MPDGVDGQPVLGVPLGRGAVQTWGPNRVRCAEARAAGGRRTAGGSGTTTAQGRARRRTRSSSSSSSSIRSDPARARQAVGERAADPLEDGRAQQELPDRRRAGARGPRRAGSRRPSARCPRTRRRTARGRGDRRATSWRAAGPRPSPRSGPGAWRSPRPTARPRRRRAAPVPPSADEPEVDSPKLGQLAGKAEAMEPQGAGHGGWPGPRTAAVAAARAGAPAAPARPVETSSCRSSITRTTGSSSALELRDEAPHQPRRRRTAGVGCELSHESVRADRRAQPLDDRQPEVLRVALLALDRHPGRPGTEARLRRSTNGAAPSSRCRPAPRASVTPAEIPADRRSYSARRATTPEHERRPSPRERPCRHGCTRVPGQQWSRVDGGRVTSRWSLPPKRARISSRTASGPCQGRRATPPSGPGASRAGAPTRSGSGRAIGRSGTASRRQ